MATTLPWRPPATEAAYRDTWEHLWDELRRLDQLVRAQTVRWRRLLASRKPESLWGMAHVSGEEVERYLAAPFTAPGELDDALEAELEPYGRAAGEIARTIERRLAATPPDAGLRLPRLVERLGLSELERDVLLLALLSELDGRFRRLFAYLRDDASLQRPSVELVLEILRADLGAGRAVFAPGAPLVRRRLVTLSDAGHPLPVRDVGIDEGVAGHLLGREGDDPRLGGVLRRAEDLPETSPELLAPERREHLVRMARGDAGVVVLHGPRGSGRLAAARVMSDALGRPLRVADVPRALAAEEGFTVVVERVVREALLAGASLAWTGCEALVDKDESAAALRTAAWRNACEDFGAWCFLASTAALETLDAAVLRLDFAVPNHGERRRLWEVLLPGSAHFAAPPPERGVLAAALADRFQLTGGQIRDAVESATALARRRDGLLVADDLYEGCRRSSTGRLRGFARRIEPRPDRDFDDLVLPPSNQRQMEELRERIRRRNQVLDGLGFERRLSLGRGIMVLFTGSSGTGKTMAAELLAREQRVDLYKIDLSAVVSKWVGETEKNLSQVFAEAEGANAVLYFDEADALFGQRGEVKDARDRWANMEVNYLLQRVEEYSGVVILTSNLRQNIDDAFSRRLQMIIEFPFPDAEHRLHIWRRTFPDGVDRPPDEELAELAGRFRLSGGEIKNIVVDAAYRALAEADGERPEIVVDHLVASIAREYQKTGRPVTISEFGHEDFEWLGREIL